MPHKYDSVGNILRMQHEAVGGSWTRRYDYATDGNRLLATSVPGDGPGVHSAVYAYNNHGSMSAMPHLAAVDWDHAEQMRHADLGGGGDVWFVYDSAGQRVRKVQVNAAGSTTSERIYLGEYEVYREHVGGALDSERQTLHVADDGGRVCMLETLTVDDGVEVAGAANTSRYQYSNHLGSVGLELDGSGQLISYEEFHPYGSTAYRAANSAIEVSASRYRYTGQKRDEETGLGHHGARYYAGWLGRWTSADPIGLGDGVNRYAYVRGRPVVLMDPSGRNSEAEHAAILQAITANESAAAMAQGEELAELQAAHTDLVDRYNALTSMKPTAAEKQTAARAQGRARRAQYMRTEFRQTQVNYLVDEFESNLRQADEKALAAYEESRQLSLTGAYLAGRPASMFGPGGMGPARVDEYRAQLGWLLRQHEGTSTEAFNEALERVRSKYNGGLTQGIVADRAAELEAFAFISPGMSGGLPGVGPQPGVIEASSRTKSHAQLRNFDPRSNPSYGGERTVEFVYDPATRRFAVGRAEGSGSPHQKLANSINPGYDPNRVVGGTFARGPGGEVLTNEYSGHFGRNWTDAMRIEFIEFLEGAMGQPVVHREWQGR